MSRNLSRREWISRWIPSAKKDQANISAVTVPEEDVSRVAIIMGRFCLAHRNTFCSICHERCPEPNAMVVDHGIPIVNADACTGCGICHDVCPAPRNAVLMKVRT